MNALRERSRLVEGEARGKESGLEQKICQVANRLVGPVSLDLHFGFLDDGIEGVKFMCLLRRHVRRHGRIAEGLGLHDTFLFYWSNINKK